MSSNRLDFDLKNPLLIYKPKTNINYLKSSTQHISKNTQINIKLIGF